LFDKLDKIKTTWNENKVAIISSPVADKLIREKFTLVVPTPIITYHTLKQLIELSGGSLMKVILSYELCKTLELPYVRTIYRAVSARYPLVDYFLKQNSENREISKSALSISVDRVNTEFANSHQDRLKTLLEIGTLVNDYQQHVLKQNEFVNKFRKSFRIPGHVQLVKSSLHCLKSRISEYELSLALCEVAKFPLSAVTNDIIDLKTGKYATLTQVNKIAENNKLPVIETKS